MTKRSVGNVLAMIAIAVASQFPDSPSADGLRYLALTYMMVDFLLRARAGYLRRRPHWTAASWRQFLSACLIPAGALMALVAMLTALELRLWIVGEPRSTMRLIWAACAGVFIVIAGGGFAVVLGWLTDGDPSQQFVLPRWLRRGRGGEAA